MSSTLPPPVQATSGALASALANAVSYPFDLVATKVQTSRARNQSHGLRAALNIINRIVDTRGLPGLYDGLETDTGATLLSNFFYFYAHSLLRNALIKHKSRSTPLDTKSSSRATLIPSVIEELVIGFFAGVASRSISTPLNLITVRLQSEKEKNEQDIEIGGDDDKDGEDGHKGKRGMIGVMKDLYAEGGIAGFWRGFTLTILLSFNPALTYAFTSFFLRFHRSRDALTQRPTALRNFLTGASGNAVAICFIYPIILAKTRLSTSEKRTTIKDVLWDAVKRDGPRGLYQGLQVQVLKGFFNQGVTVLMKQRIETRIVQLYNTAKNMK